MHTIQHLYDHQGTETGIAVNSESGERAFVFRYGDTEHGPAGAVMRDVYLPLLARKLCDLLNGQAPPKVVADAPRYEWPN